MSQKRDTIWEKPASRRLIFICFLLIIVTFICFGGTYLEYRASIAAYENKKQSKIIDAVIE